MWDVAVLGVYKIFSYFKASNVRRLDFDHKLKGSDDYLWPHILEQHSRKFP